MVGQWFPNAREAVQHLKRKIAQLKEEEPQMRYVEDHQLIHKRRKNEPCIPIVTGQSHDQEAWFANLESNGIWDTVFKYVTNPSDITSAYFACEMFRKHLEETRMLMLLPKVFGALRSSGYLQYSGFKGNISNEKKDQNRHILNLRLVSKAWKKSAEDAFLVPLSFPRTPSLPIWHPENWDWDSQMVLRLHSVGDVEKALEKLENTHSCAPLIRFVVVSDDHDSSVGRASFHEKLLQFFHRHGEAVWKFSFSQARPQRSGDFTYESFRNMVCKMPQLKSLSVTDSISGYKAVKCQLSSDTHFSRILPGQCHARNTANYKTTKFSWKTQAIPLLFEQKRFAVFFAWHWPGRMREKCVSDDSWHFTGYRDDDWDATMEREFQQSKARVRSAIQGNPFPFHPSMEFCCIEGYPQRNEFLISEILSRNVNLKAVNLNFSWEDYHLLGVCWNGLSALQLQYFEIEFGANISREVFFQDLFHLAEQNWPLKYLVIRYKNDVEDGQNYTEVSDFFKLLHQFKNSLEDVVVETDCWIRADDRGNNDLGVVVDLPNLKEIDFPEFANDNADDEQGA